MNHAEGSPEGRISNRTVSRFRLRTNSHQAAIFHSGGNAPVIPTAQSSRFNRCPSGRYSKGASLYPAFQEYFGRRNHRCSQFWVSTIPFSSPQARKPTGGSSSRGLRAEDKAHLVKERAVIFLSPKRERASPPRWHHKISPMRNRRNRMIADHLRLETARVTQKTKSARS